MVPEWTDTTVMAGNTVIVSTLTYEAIKRGKKPNYRAVLGKVDLVKKDLIGFPCKPRLIA